MQPRGLFAVVIVATCGALCPVAAGAAEHAKPKTLDHLLSTGDNHFGGHGLPMNSREEIRATFDLIRALYPARRIYWRGLQDCVVSGGTVPEDSPRIAAYFKFAKHLIDDVGINRIGVEEAHERGMEIWGWTSLYEWGINPDGTSFFGYPGDYQSAIARDNPQWLPVDKYGHRRQSGPLEFAHPEARAAVIDFVESHLAADGYDGILFHTYVENVTLRFGDEFGFSDPAVAEFKRRHGVDVRTQPFDVRAWRHLRGEYTTQLLEELRAALPAKTKIAMTIAPHDPGQPQLWWEAPYPTAGQITMDWRAWADQRLVDTFVVWGGNENAFKVRHQLLDHRDKNAKDTMEVAFITSSPLSEAQQPYYDRGAVGIAAMDSLGEAFLFQGSSMPAEPKSSLGGGDTLRRMKVLQQIIDGETKDATAAEVAPLTKADSLCERRMALFALAKLADPRSVPTIEAALEDSVGAVRSAAMIALSTLSRPESVDAILRALQEHPEFPLLDAAFQALVKPPFAPALAAGLTSPSAAVRSAAARALSHFPRAEDEPALREALDDSEPYVRYYAVQALGNLPNGDGAVTALLAELAGTDTTTSAHSATALAAMLARGDPAAVARRADILTGLDAALKAQGDGSRRGDRAWAYRLIGPAVIAAGDDGKALLRRAMDQRTDRRLAEIAWAALYLPEKPGAFSPVAEAEDAEAHRHKPQW
jgi:hypothetical protein